MTKKIQKCYIYTRVSTAIQVDGYSLEAQKDKLRKYAAFQDYSIAGEYSDEGFSGKNIQGRLDFQRMLQDIQDRKDDVDYVLVFKLSRFGRNAADVLNSLQLMQDFGVNLICVEDGIDSSKDAGKLMISVLSAVAEIERENIRTQTMAGREQKAREGRWNGGFAPYGYKLVDGELMIAEDEAEVIRLIYDRYIHTNEGTSSVAKYLNDHGYVKKIRQNGTIPGFSDHFVKKVIDNPVYMGKIAYGRRRTEKKIGTRNEMHVVEQSEFPVYDGKHEAIISEADWNLAQEKRKKNAYRREKVHDVNHVHLLSGLLRCPDCGKPLYGNIAKAHSKDNKTRYYYYCKNTRGETGHRCSFRTNLEQTEIDRYVAAIISAMVHDKQFEEAIQKKIGTAVNTDDLEKELDTVKSQLRQLLSTKSRLENQMDTLDVSDPRYERKILDLQRRYDDQYDKIAEAELQIEDIRKRIQTIRSEQISGENVYQLLLAFDELYGEMDEPGKKELLRAIIERIDLYPEKREDGCWIRNIVFTFPVPIQGHEVKELPLEKSTLIDEWGVLYHQLSDKIELHTDVEEMLSTFSENNLNQIILSAFKTDEITKYARKFSIEHYFDDILGTQNIVMESKTARGKRYMQENGFTSEQTLYIGDTVHDYDTARGLGIDCILFSGGQQSPKLLKQCGVPVYNNFVDIANLLTEDM
jgi:site-specific DNA recombinase